MLLRLAVLCVWLGMIVPEHPDLSFPEGALVGRALDVARGESPYHDWRLWPHAFAPYPPLAYYPAGWAARALAGPAPAPHTVYMVGRSFSLLAMLGVFTLIYLFGRRLGLSRV